MNEKAPFSRPVRVDALPREGETFAIEASAAERAALADLFKLPDIAALTATLRVRPEARGGARVTGAVHGECTQECVVTLEPVGAIVEEEIDLRFAPAEAPPRRAAVAPEIVSMTDADAPDPIVDGRIDLGALAAEFFALGLEPYPRKPGASFEPPDAGAAVASPFAVVGENPRKTRR